MDKLYIAEKKDIGLAIADYLWPDKSYRFMPADRNISNCQYVEKDGTVVSWAKGHLMQYMPPDVYNPEFKSWNIYPVFPKNLIPLPVKESIGQFNVLCKLIGDSTEVVHAGDPDREGQLLIDEILSHCRYKGKTSRLLINAKDKLSMERAFKEITDNKKFATLYAAGVARAQYDWLVGYNLTRAYSKAAEKFGYTENWSIGRVRTPTLALVVKREDEIRYFRTQKYYLLKAFFQIEKKAFTAIWKPKEDLLDSEGRLLDKKIIQKLIDSLSNTEGIVKEVKVEKGSTYPPLPYSLDTLQIDADKQYNLPPNKVLDIVEELYLKELTTYPRSDCNYLPTSQHADSTRILNALSASGFLSADNADEKLISKAWNDKKISAHHAIIPTSVAPKTELSEETALVYKMICERYICQFYPPCQFEKTTFTISLDDANFSGSGKVILNSGFMALKAGKEDVIKRTDEEEEDNLELPKLKEGQIVGKPAKLELVEKNTRPPKRFTQGTLLQAMTNIYKYMAPDNPNREKIKEVKGIGTPATRHVIIEELLASSRNNRKVTPFLSMNKKHELVPSEFGHTVIDNMDDYLKHPDHTALMEFKLQAIVDGNLSLEAYIEEAQKRICDSINYTSDHKFTSPTSSVKFDCPICKEYPLVRKYSPKTKRYFWVCLNQACTDPFTKKTVFYNELDGKPNIQTCPICHGLLAQKNGSNGVFWVCSKDKAHTFNDHKDKPVIAFCPDDNSLLRQKKSTYGLFWSCPTCRKIFKDEDGLPAAKDPKPIRKHKQ